MKTRSKISHFARHVFPRFTLNALNALKRGLLGRDFVDHVNLLAKLKKVSSQVLTADLKQMTILRLFPQNQ